MDVHVLYTSPFQFLASLVITPPASSLQQGKEGVFGIGICPVPDVENPEQEALALHFLEIDLRVSHVRVYSPQVPFIVLYHLEIGYDTLHNVWIAALMAGVKKHPDDYVRDMLDFYQVVRHEATPWVHLQRWERSEEGGGDKGFLAFWQQGQSFPLLLTEYLGDGLAASASYLTQWRTQEAIAHRSERKLGQAFITVPFVFDETFLLLTAECRPETARWRFRVTTYTMDGTRLAHKLIPGVSLPSMYEFPYFADDMWDWLWPTIVVAKGPRGGREDRATCVAALVLQVLPEKSRKWREGRLHLPEGLPQTQGGLYWIDQHGDILRYEASPLGTSVSLCLCGDHVVGSDCLDGQWRLWSWSLLETKARKIHAYLAKDIKNVLVVASEDQPAVFWCLEEYSHGLRVSLWNREDFREVQSFWREKIGLAYHASGPGPYVKPCVNTHATTLLVIALTEDRQFQVLQFQTH